MEKLFLILTLALVVFACSEDNGLFNWYNPFEEGTFKVYSELKDHKKN